MNKQSFEESFARLEAILEAMNGGDVELEESLKLFEEAEGLMKGCFQKLQEAEEKVESLIKQRSGDFALDEGGQPKTEPVSFQRERGF